MKFLCPSCKAKYQIADEKVSGRSVRMKCRKCGFIIPISEVPPAPPSMTPEGAAPPPKVPKAPPAPNVTAPGQTPPSPAASEGKPAKPATPAAPPAAPGSRVPVPRAGTGGVKPGSAPSASRGPLPPRAGPKAPGGLKPGAPAATEQRPSPAATEQKSSPAATEQKSSPAATDERKSAPGAQRPLPPVEPKPGAPAKRPAPADAKPQPPSKVTASPQPPSAARPSAAGAPPKSSPTAPKVAPAEPGSSPVAAAPAPPAAPAPEAPSAPQGSAPAIDQLLSAVEEEGEDVTRIAPGGALAEAFGALVSGAQPAPAVIPHTADEWYVGINDVPVGPIRLNELRKRAVLGAVTMESLVWRDGLDAWRPLKTFPELVAVLEEGMSSVFGSRAPLAAKPPSESDPFGSGASPAFTGPVMITDDLVVAGIPRSRTPIGAWIAIAIALAFGVVIGFVAFSKQQQLPPETIVKYVEVPADGGVQPGAAAVAQDGPEAAPEASSATAAKPKTGSKPKATETAAKESGGLQGLKGLSGLSPGGPSGPGGTTPGTTPAGGGGQLDGSQIQATVAKYTGSVKRSCWQPALDSRDPSAPTSARVMVTIVVGPSGSVQNVSTSGEPRGYPGLASCIAGRVRGWTFPASGGTTTANVPFVFAAQ